MDPLHHGEPAGPPLQADVQHHHGDIQDMLAHLVDALPGSGRPEDPIVFFEDLIEDRTVQLRIVDDQ